MIKAAFSGRESQMFVAFTVGKRSSKGVKGDLEKCEHEAVMILKRPFYG